MIFFLLCRLSLCNSFQGEFKLEVKSLANCNPISDANITYNLYLYKVSETNIEIRGTQTFKIPIDDTLTVSSKILY